MRMQASATKSERRSPMRPARKKTPAKPVLRVSIHCMGRRYAQVQMKSNRTVRRLVKLNSAVCTPSHRLLPLHTPLHRFPPPLPPTPPPSAPPLPLARPRQRASARCTRNSPRCPFPPDVAQLPRCAGSEGPRGARCPARTMFASDGVPMGWRLGRCARKEGGMAREGGMGGAERGGREHAREKPQFSPTP